ARVERVRATRQCSSRGLAPPRASLLRGRGVEAHPRNPEPTRLIIARVTLCLVASNEAHGSLRMRLRRSGMLRTLKWSKRRSPAASSSQVIGVDTGALARARSAYGAIAVAPTALRR